MERPIRKEIRLREYDYSQGGAYFITICTKDRKELLGRIDNVGARIARPQEPYLSNYGKIVKEAILRIEDKYPSVCVDKYVIMPNHIHLILMVEQSTCGSAMRSPTISTVINQMKGYVSKKIGCSIWQRSYYDHIIRGENDYFEIWKYIDQNPLEWELDELHTPEE